MEGWKHWSAPHAQEQSVQDDAIMRCSGIPMQAVLQLEATH